MAWFGAAYATEDPRYLDYRNRTQYFGGSDTQAAQALNQQLGGQQNAQAVGAQAMQQAQANAMGMANTARGGRGNALARSAMLQAPQSRQMATQAQYQQQQANFQNAQNAQEFEAGRRAAVEGQNLGKFTAQNEDVLRQQRETNNTIHALGGIMEAVGGAGAMSDKRSKNVLGGKVAQTPGVVIMIGCGEYEHAMGMGDDESDDDDDESDAGNDAVDAMRELEPANFEYKDEFKGEPGAGDGEYTGIMAQDLEKTPAGRGTVTRRPDGMRQVDGAKLATLNSAALSKVVKDVDKLKGAKRG